MLWAGACIGPAITSGAIECGPTGSCPQGFECAIDGFCHRNAGTCGDGELDPGETCDPTALCAKGCNDGNACTVDVGLGAAMTCNFRCAVSNIEVCEAGDGCCPASCRPGTDRDCSVTCGNGTLEPGETCEPPVFPCDSDCNDGDACTVDSVTGSAGNCNVACSFAPISGCVDDDGCCPAGCLNATDNDCSAKCGDGTIDRGETCDPPATCPKPNDCDDGVACTIDVYLGSPANCNARCRYTEITACSNDSDGCCPAGCDDQDPDCVPPVTCGNGAADPGETCDDSDPDFLCPTSCENLDACLISTLVGNPDDCTAECVKNEITECLHDDGCCPVGCAFLLENGEPVDWDCCEINDMECPARGVDPV